MEVALSINIIHGIKKNTILYVSIENDAINKDVPILVKAVILVDMLPLGGDAMVAFVDVEHFAREVSKVLVCHLKLLKAIVGASLQLNYESLMASETSKVWSRLL